MTKMSKLKIVDMDTPTREDIIRAELDLISELGARLNGAPFRGQGGGKPITLEWEKIPLSPDQSFWYNLKLPDGQVYRGRRKTVLAMALECSIKKWRPNLTGFFGVHIYRVVHRHQEYWVAVHRMVIGNNPVAGGRYSVREVKLDDDIEVIKAWAKAEAAKKLLSLSRARMKKL